MWLTLAGDEADCQPSQQASPFKSRTCFPTASTRFTPNWSSMMQSPFRRGWAPQLERRASQKSAFQAGSHSTCWVLLDFAGPERLTCSVIPAMPSFHRALRHIRAVMVRLSVLPSVSHFATSRTLTVEYLASRNLRVLA